eukprot:scaffold5540_cov96-Cylindrotheca_fusiformis.AAC.3
MEDTTPSPIVVNDETDLSTLIGENGKFRKLVEAKFKSEFGNLTWRAARLSTMEEFLDRYSSNAPAVWDILRDWIAHYRLEGGFKAPERLQTVEAGAAIIPDLWLSDTLMEKLWYSVLRIENDDNGDRATALVFDVHEDASGPFLLLLVNEHFHFQGGQLVKLYYVDDESDLFLVHQFRKGEVRVFNNGGGLDFIIYRVNLGEEWSIVEPGKAQREEMKATKRARRAAASEPMKWATIICKTPPYTYGIQRSMNVRLLGFPAAVDKARFQVDAQVASIGRNSFCVTTLSAPGLSGGAIVATCMGQIVGVGGAAMDATEQGRETKRFVTYAIPAHSLPNRPSMQPSSPEARAPARLKDVEEGSDN